MVYLGWALKVKDLKDYLTASFRDLPALKVGSFIAGI
jgi:hypothetical protein